MKNIHSLSIHSMPNADYNTDTQTITNNSHKNDIVALITLTLLRIFIWSKILMILHCTVCTIHAGGHHQDTKVRVNIKVKDVNDNPPEFATNNEVLMCETVAPGKVRLSV